MRTRRTKEEGRRDIQEACSDNRPERAFEALCQAQGGILRVPPMPSYLHRGQNGPQFETVRRAEAYGFPSPCSPTTATISFPPDDPDSVIDYLPERPDDASTGQTPITKWRLSSARRKRVRPPALCR